MSKNVMALWLLLGAKLAYPFAVAVFSFISI